MMPAVCSAAPTFDALAVVDRDLLRFTWAELHAGQWLVLAFDPMAFTSDTVGDLLVLAEGKNQLRALRARLVVVSRQSEYEILAWVNRPRNEGGLGNYEFPIVADTGGQVARKYGMLLDGGEALRGHFVIDPDGVIRQAEVTTLPLPSNVHEIVRCIEILSTDTRDGLP